MTLNLLLKEVFSIKESEVDDSSRLMSFDSWDSMAHMFFITRLEESFEIVLDGDEIASMETIGDVKRMLEAKGKAA